MRLTHAQNNRVCESCDFEEPEDESWLLTYGDAITLVLTFFVLLISVSTIDQSKFDQVMQAIQGHMSGQYSQVSQFDKLKASILEIAQKKLKDAVEVTKDPLGLTIELASNDLFAVGKADIQKKAQPALAEIAKTISNFGQKYGDYQIEVEGHTDDVPIHNERFPSNWELSTARATNVVKFFIKHGVDKYHLKAAGYADLFPKVPNRDASGKPIPENRAKNRRIVILVHRNDQFKKPLINQNSQRAEGKRP